jgi:hypothetical protein
MPPNDIEFSGERKRVRCNEGLGHRDGKTSAMPLPHAQPEREEQESDE